MEFESLKSKKFKVMKNDQMVLFKGGAGTPGGNQQAGIPVTQSNQNGAWTVTRYRSWTSDALVDGVMCYYGEGYYYSSVAAC